MTDQTLHRFREVLSDPERRPRNANLAVAAAYALLGVLAFAYAAVAGDDGAGLLGLPALAFAVFYLAEAYGFHWHAKYTFDGYSRSFALGSVGAALGLCGLLVLFVVPAVGVTLAAVGAACNVLGASWGTFVYTYRTYAPD